MLITLSNLYSIILLVLFSTQMTFGQNIEPDKTIFHKLQHTFKDTHIEGYPRGGNRLSPKFLLEKKYKDFNFSKDTVINLSDEKIVLDINTPNSVFINIDYNSSIKEVIIYITNVDTLRITGQLNNSISIIKSEIKEQNIFDKANVISIEGCLLKEVNLEGIHLNHLGFVNSHIYQLNLKDSEIRDSLSFRDIKLDSVIVTNALFPKYIRMDTVDLNEIKMPIDLTKLKPLYNSTFHHDEKLERKFRLSTIDVKKLNFSYDRVSFHIDTLQDPKHRKKIFEYILKKFSENGFESDYFYYHIQYQDILDSENHKRLTNFVNYYWWGNGRNKGNVVKISAAAFGIFIIINLFSFGYLIEVYSPEVFKKKYGITRSEFNLPLDPKKNALRLLNGRSWRVYHRRYVYLVIVFTSNVFWGLKLDIKDITIKYWGALFLLTVQYLVGLICVAYLISFILVK